VFEQVEAKNAKVVLGPEDTDLASAYVSPARAAQELGEGTSTKARNFRVLEIHVPFTHACAVEQIFCIRDLFGRDEKIDVAGRTQAGFGIEATGGPSLKKDGFDAGVAEKMADGGNILLMLDCMNGVGEVRTAQRFERGHRKRRIRVAEFPPGERACARLE
jgi:hypothetical protein